MFVLDGTLEPFLSARVLLNLSALRPVGGDHGRKGRTGDGRLWFLLEVVVCRSVSCCSRGRDERERDKESR